MFEECESVLFPSFIFKCGLWTCNHGSHQVLCEQAKHTLIKVRFPINRFLFTQGCRQRGISEAENTCTLCPESQAIESPVPLHIAHRTLPQAISTVLRVPFALFSLYAFLFYFCNAFASVLYSNICNQGCYPQLRQKRPSPRKGFLTKTPVSEAELGHFGSWAILV